MSDDLITWLRGVLDEDEWTARSWLEASGRLNASVDSANAIEHRIWLLADIAAKRAILELHTIWTKPEMKTVGGPIPEVSRSGRVTLTHWKPGPPYTTQPTGRTLYVCGTCDCGGNEDYYSPGLACPTVLLLASAYAHRPGYRDEWAPGYLTAAKNG